MFFRRPYKTRTSQTRFSSDFDGRLSEEVRDHKNEMTGRFVMVQ